MKDIYSKFKNLIHTLINGKILTNVLINKIKTDKYIIKLKTLINLFRTQYYLFRTQYELKQSVQDTVLIETICLGHNIN